MGSRNPASHINWRRVDSSNVEAVGWDSSDNMYVLFKHGGLYLYTDVPRQRVVAAAEAQSVGRYVNKEIIPHYKGTRIESPVPIVL